MFSNLKKKIESEVGDLGRLAPSIMNRASTTASSNLSSRHPSVSSLVSEPATFNLSSSASFSGGNNPSNNNASSSSISQQNPTSPLIDVPSPRGLNMSLGGSGGGGGGGATQHRLKQLEEKLQAQESDFAWRLSTKDDEISNLNRSISILTAQLRQNESEVKKRLVRVQDDMDDLQGFSQQENAKLKHLLLNKEEELGAVRNNVIVQERELEEMRGRVKELEVENERVRNSLDKLSNSSRAGGGVMTALIEASTSMEEVPGGEDPLLIKGLNDRVASLTEEVERERGVAKGITAEMEVAKKLYENEAEAMRGELQRMRQADIVRGVEVEGLRGNLGVKVEECEVLGGRVRELEAEVEKRSVEKEEESNVMRGRVMDVEGKVRELEEINESLRRELEDEKGGRGGDGTSSGEADSEEVMKRLQNEMGVLTTKLEEAGRVEVELRNELDLARKELKKKGEEVEVIRREIGVLRSENENGQKENGELKIRMEELEENHKMRVVRLEESWGMRLAEELDYVKTDLQGRFMDQVDDFRKRSANEIKELKRRKDEVEAYMEKVRNELRVVKEEVVVGLEKELEAERLNLKAEIERSGGEVQRMEKLVAELRESLGNVEKERDEAVENVGAVVIDMNEKVKQDMENFAARVEEERDARVGELRKRIEEVEAQRDEAVARGDQLKVMLKEEEEKREEIEKKTVEEEEEKQEIGKAEEEVRRLREEVAKLREDVKEVDVMGRLLSDIESEKNELLVSVSDQCARVDELEEELKSLREEKEVNDLQVANEGKAKIEETRKRVNELEAIVAEKDKQLRQQSHALSDLRRSLAKELKASSGGGGAIIKNEDSTQESSSSSSSSTVTMMLSHSHHPHVNGSLPNNSSSSVLGNNSSSLLMMQDTISSSGSNSSSSSNISGGVNSSSHGIIGNNSSSSMMMVSGGGGGGAAATLPQYETDVNFMYLRSVMFKYLTSQDPQITSHLTRVVATLLHLTEDETNTLIAVQTEQQRSSSQHLLSHIINK